MTDIKEWIVWVIFGLTYAGLAFGRVPGLRIDRAGIALVGATLMLATGVLSFDAAIASDSVDYRTLALLVGMMIVVGALRISGFFEQLTAAALRRLKSPKGLLIATIALSGLLSAFLINDVVCVALTPLVLHLARKLKVDPIPHLIGLATAANIGSTGTITGNPQNIYIGTHSGISYLRFAERLMPIALIGLVIDFLIIALIYRGRLAASTNANADSRNAVQSTIAIRALASPQHTRMRIKATILTIVAVVLFFTGLPLEIVALGAAAIVLLDRISPKKIFGQVDWQLLVMFAGLFIVVHAFQVSVVAHWGVERWIWLLDRPVDLLSLISAALSNLVSNVPAVLLLDPVAQAVPEANRESAWLALAMSSTLAGNFTVLGSVANLIVVENAARVGVRISFGEYCRAGIPVTLATLAIGIVWLQFVPY